jgi:hypothetical protein
MEKELTDYIFTYCSGFFSETESKAHRHHFGTIKFTSYSENHTLIKEVKKKFITDDPSVLKLLEGGYTEFMQNTAERIYKDHESDLELNLCPRCDKIARTPKAKQCRFCGYDWHDGA